MSNWYPKWVYVPNEDITEENKRKYDIRREACYREMQEMKANLGRDLNFEEKLDLMKKHGI